MSKSTEEVGTDGLTDAERAESLAEYRRHKGAKVLRGALARAAALEAGDPDWASVTRWDVTEATA